MTTPAPTNRTTDTRSGWARRRARNASTTTRRSRRSISEPYVAADIRLRRRFRRAAGLHRAFAGVDHRAHWRGPVRLGRRDPAECDPARALRSAATARSRRRRNRAGAQRWDRRGHGFRPERRHDVAGRRSSCSADAGARCWRWRSSCWCWCRCTRSTKVGTTPRASPARAMQHAHIVSVGLTVLLLLLPRLWLRWTAPAPARPMRVPAAADALARHCTTAFLLTLLAFCVTGPLFTPGPRGMKSGWFGAVTLPALPPELPDLGDPRLPPQRGRVLDPLPHGLHRAGRPLAGDPLSHWTLAAVAGFRLGAMADAASGQPPARPSCCMRRSSPSCSTSAQ